MGACIIVSKSHFMPIHTKKQSQLFTTTDNKLKCSKLYILKQKLKFLCGRSLRLDVKGRNKQYFIYIKIEKSGLFYDAIPLEIFLTNVAIFGNLVLFVALSLC